MATLSQPYYDCVKRTLYAALCIGNYPSRVVERHNKPEVEVADFTTHLSRKGEGVAPQQSPSASHLASPLSCSSFLADSGGPNPATQAVPELLLNPIRICRTAHETCLIEPTVNSVRVSFTFSKGDAVAELIMQKYVSFMEQRAAQFHVLRRKPVAGYDVTFLVTHEEVETMDRAKLVDFIILFVMNVDADIAALKLSANERARAAAREFFGSTNYS